MTKKEICEAYIETTLEVQSLEDNLGNAFAAFNTDNQFLGIIPDGYRNFLGELFTLAVGETNQDWTDYWIYECYAKGPTTIGIDGKEYTVNNFNELWLLVGED